MHWNLFLRRIAEDTRGLVEVQDVDRGTGLFDFWVEEFQGTLRKRRIKVDGGGVVVYRIAMFQYQGHRPPLIKKSTPQTRRNITKFCESLPPLPLCLFRF